MRKIIIVPYDDRWPEMFEAESLLIKTLLGGMAKHVHHIGSTSVHGLSAKPVIDMLLEVSDINELDKYLQQWPTPGMLLAVRTGLRGADISLKVVISVVIKSMRLQSEICRY